MAIRLDKPWRPLISSEVASLPGMLGVYEIADASETVERVGYAGGRSLFGLRSELEGALADAEAAGTTRQFRVEINQQYLTRRHELLMVHVADHGCLPIGNEADVDAAVLLASRLSPGG